MAANQTIYVLDPYHPAAISRLKQDLGITTVLSNDPRIESWHGNADAVMVRSETRLGADDFSKATRLRVVVKQGVGVDNIDLDAAKEHGVAVHNTPALNSEAVAELCMALTLSLSRRVCEADRRIRRGENIVRSEMLGMSLFQKTIGVIGMGNIGKVVAKKWIGAFQCRIISYDPFASRGAWSDIPHGRVDTLEELLKAADVVTIHVPLVNSTRRLIGEKELRIMKENAILVNCARGGVVDEKALTNALKEERIRGAVLDATEVEPPTMEAYGELLECESVIITPHIGASTMENQSQSGIAVVDTILAVLEGKADVPGKLV